MGDRDATPGTDDLVFEAVDWLPSGGRSGLIRVRGRWHGKSEVALPQLILERGGEVHRLASLPDPGAGRDPGAWRGAYVVQADLAEAPDVRLSLEFPGGGRIALDRPVVRSTAEAPVGGGADVVDRAVLADRRARRAEAAEAAQARISREALKAVEVLELRAAQLEEQLEAARAERDALSAQAGAAVPGAEVEALRRRLADAEAAARAAEARAAAVPEPVAPRETHPDALAAAERRAERLREALTAAIGTAGDLRIQLHEARVRARTTEIAHAAERVRLTVLASERAAVVAEITTLRRALQAAHELAGERAAAGERAQARAAGAEAAHAETRRRFTERVAELREAREGIARLEAELAASRAEARRIAEEEIPAAVREAVAEHEKEMLLRHEEAERAFAAREAEARTALDGARAELERAEAAARADVARAEAALAQAETARAMAEAAAAGATAELRAAHVARASLAEQVARLGDPAALDALKAELEDTRAVVAAQVAELEDARAAVAAQAAELEVAARAAQERDAELAQARELAARTAEERDARERELRSAHAALEALEQEAAAASVPAPPPVPPELPDRAAEQEQAAAAAEPPAAPERMVADLAAAAEALRARSREPGPEPEPEPEPGPEAAGPTIVSAPEARARVATGRDSRDYPALRGALVKLAHDDAAAAARLIAGLLPAQWRVVPEPVDYDITIAELGTFAVTVTAGSAAVRPIAGTRSRREAEFHLRADALTLAEMLAGVGPQPRRFGRARVSGRARRAKAIQRIPAARMSLAEVVRAGARLEPELVLRTLAYAVHPSWTRGHDFTIAQTFTGPEGEDTLYIRASDGRGLSVGHTPPAEPPRTSVLITRTAFEAMLRGEAPPPGERPVTRGDHRAADTLRAWADRARAGQA